MRAKLVGAVYGLLIGDALGVPYEFHAASDLPEPRWIEFDPPQNFRRAHAGVLPGTWSDDGAQALVLLHSLLSCGCFDPDHFAVGLINWYEHGFMAVDFHVFDVGVQTAAAITRLRHGTDPLFAGGTDEEANGNGSLMRVLPLALWHKGDDAALIADAFAQSSLTHGHIRAKLCCALYCLWARRIMVGQPIEVAWDDAVSKLRKHFPAGPRRDELEGCILPESDCVPRGSGYVVDCLFSARHAVRAPDFTAAVKRAVALGEDTDTTACVAGGIAGLDGGIEAIPAHWLAGLRGKVIVEPLLERLCRHWDA